MKRTHASTLALAAFLAAALPAFAEITPLGGPGSFSNSSQILVTFLEKKVPSLSESDGVRFSYAGGAVPVKRDCGVHPYGPTRCRTLGFEEGDEFIGAEGEIGTKLVVTLPFPTKRVGLEVYFHVHGLNQFTQIAFFRGSAQVGTAQTPTHSDTGRPVWFWVGYESTEEFDRIELTPPYISIGLDNLRFDASQRFRLLGEQPFGEYTGFDVGIGPVTSINGVGIHHGTEPVDGCCGGTQGFVWNGFQVPPRPLRLIDRPIEIAFPRPVNQVGFVLGSPGGMDQPGNGFLITLMRGTEVVQSGLVAPQGFVSTPPLFYYPFWGVEGPAFTKVLLTHMQQRLTIDEMRWTYAPPEPPCGDGALGADEQCDDGNLTNGDGCSSVCRVEDVPDVNQAPVARCAQDFNVTTGPSCQAFFSVDAGSFDPDNDPLSSFQTPIALALDPNTTTFSKKAAVFLGALDPGGKSSSCYSAVTLRDFTRPTVHCGSAIVECQGPGPNAPGANVPLAPLAAQFSASDECAVRSTSCGPYSSLFYELGTNKTEFGQLFSCGASDWSGNSTSCTPTVTVVDTTPPSVSCVKAPQNGPYYQVFGEDSCNIFVELSLGGIPLYNGETIMVVQRGGSGAQVIGPQTGSRPRIFAVGQDVPFEIVASDGTNTARAACPPLH